MGFQGKGKFEKNPDELGALWIKKGQKGTFLSGTCGGENIVIFKNEKKSKESQPDYRILRSKPRDMQQPQEDDGDIPF